jgi:hypothetical protein
MRYEMHPRGEDMWEHMEDDVLFNRWWAQMAGDKQLLSTKKIAYGAWQAGIREFIKSQVPIAYWESSIKQADHVTFDKDLADKWKMHYNMAVEPLFTLPHTEVSKKVSKECIDD